jgi:hypothetical protein
MNFVEKGQDLKDKFLFAQQCPHARFRGIQKFTAVQNLPKTQVIF